MNPIALEELLGVVHEDKKQRFQVAIYQLTWDAAFSRRTPYMLDRLRRESGSYTTRQPPPIEQDPRVVVYTLRD